MLTESVMGKLKKLPDGWAGALTKKFTSKAVRKARKVLTSIENGRMPFPAVSPMPNGCIALTWVSPCREVMINIDRDGDAHFMTSLKKIDADYGEIERLDSEGSITDLLTVDQMLAWYCADKAERA